MAETVTIAYTVTVAVEVDPAGIPECDGPCWDGDEQHTGECRPAVVSVSVWDEVVRRPDELSALDAPDPSAYSTGTPGGPAALAGLYDLADAATWPAWEIG